MNLYMLYKILFVLSHLIVASGMFSKRRLPDFGEDPPEKRLRTNIADLFLENDISGVRAQSILDDAHASGLQAFRELAKAPAGGKPRTQNNIARNLRRKLNKRSNWPSQYFAKVRVWNKRTQKETTTWLPFVLPHELLAAMQSSNEANSLLDTRMLSNSALSNLRAACAMLQDERLVPVGLWGDGVPCNFDRSESIEMFAMSFPGKESWKHLRLPLVVISKKFLVSEHTYDDILDVIAWSLQCSALGFYPCQRHDGSRFLPHDSKRMKLAAKALSAKGVLCEIRGDWMMYTEVFRFPNWNSKGGCCFRCAATPQSLQDFSLQAPWRGQRLSHWDLISRILEQGKTVSPIFAAPGVTSATFQIDWLHCADHGVAADFLGNFLWSMLSKFPGASKAARCENLWLDLQNWYDHAAVEDRLDTLKLSMLKAAKQAPKLRSKAAQARALVPYARELSERLLGDTGLEQSMKACAVHLHNCYCCLSAGGFDPDVLGDSCRKFLILYKGLNDVSTEPWAWRIKPKFHMWQELCEMSTDLPSLSWTYRDEDFGGTVAKYSKRRGGKNTPLSTGKNVLMNFYAKHSVPAA